MSTATAKFIGWAQRSKMSGSRTAYGEIGRPPQPSSWSRESSQTSFPPPKPRDRLDNFQRSPPPHLNELRETSNSPRKRTRTASVDAAHKRSKLDGGFGTGSATTTPKPAYKALPGPHAQLEKTKVNGDDVPGKESLPSHSGILPPPATLPRPTMQSTPSNDLGLMDVEFTNKSTERDTAAVSKSRSSSMEENKEKRQSVLEQAARLHARDFLHLTKSTEKMNKLIEDLEFIESVRPTDKGLLAQHEARVQLKTAEVQAARNARGKNLKAYIDTLMQFLQAFKPDSDPVSIGERDDRLYKVLETRLQEIETKYVKHEVFLNKLPDLFRRLLAKPAPSPAPTTPVIDEEKKRRAVQRLAERDGRISGVEDAISIVEGLVGDIIEDLVKEQEARTDVEKQLKLERAARKRERDGLQESIRTMQETLKAANDRIETVELSAKGDMAAITAKLDEMERGYKTVVAELKATTEKRFDVLRAVLDAQWEKDKQYTSSQDTRISNVERSLAGLPRAQNEHREFLANLTKPR